MFVDFYEVNLFQDETWRKNDNIQCINYTTKTETVREQVQNMLKQLHFSSRPAFLLSKTACRAA
ncbi:hypothetical protein DWZ81_19415 [Parabacteroides merdae]|nr:hypothetical protein DWZ81_19415 [Parabacteroides merdae]